MGTAISLLKWTVRHREVEPEFKRSLSLDFASLKLLVLTVSLERTFFCVTTQVTNVSSHAFVQDGISITIAGFSSFLGCSFRSDCLTFDRGHSPDQCSGTQCLLLLYSSLIRTEP